MRFFFYLIDITNFQVKSVFDICFEAESVPLEIQSYREKLKWLRKLEYSFIEKNLPAAYEEHLKQVSNKFLIF